MVATVTAVIAHAHNDEKKRPPPMERTRAMHLSRQLQMRLQYAKLKVEHGWTKQRLNEVENLYFRMSHGRGPKAHSAGPTVIINDTHSPAPASQSALSFKSRPPIDVDMPPIPTARTITPLQPSPFPPDRITPPVPVPSIRVTPPLVVYQQPSPEAFKIKPWPSPALTPTAHKPLSRTPTSLAPNNAGQTYDSFWSSHSSNRSFSSRGSVGTDVGS